MNKAFEEILGRLEELRETYDEMAFIEMNTNGHTLDFEYAKGKKDVMLDVKKIVQEVAEEYNGGWIPCGERLPEAGKRYLVSAIWKDKDFEKSTVYDAVYGSDGLWHSYHYEPVSYKVVAWQPLPKPFKERD